MFRSAKQFRQYGYRNDNSRIRRSTVYVLAMVTTEEGIYSVQFPATIPGNCVRMADLASMLAAQIKHDRPEAIAERITQVDAIVFDQHNSVSRRFRPVTAN